ncbi:lymphocyte antigen 75-like [Papilio machaon]|uniref:lymphocyte antigen 75-like n=1 Tax=Papilio machaon TaxID=76193 RepID=UPI001E66324B|nr:lymphocyte antigen 75-like [Papilio machaon]
MKYLFRTVLYGLKLLSAIELCVSQRPNYREDFRFEKAFNSFYKLHSAASWSNARIRCEAEGSHLMVPDTLDEADAMPLLIASTLTTYEGVYVGIHDFYTERYFVTIKGSKLRDSILDLLWEAEQPVHGGGRCVAMRRNGRFYVNPCTNQLPFICKTKANRVSYYQECDTFDSRWKLGNNGSCYITHAEPQTWHEAHGTCLSAGGYLAILDTRDEAEYIREQFKNVDQVKTPGDFAFLGFSDLFQAYHYRTVHGKPLNRFLDWDLKCPQSDGAKTNADRCGGIRRSGLLATADCTHPSIFFCEKPAKGTYQFKSLRHNDFHKHHKHIKKEIKLEEKTYLLYLLFFYVWLWYSLLPVTFSVLKVHYDIK